MEFGDYIWNLLGKCNQISSNMHGIGLVICEIAFDILNILRKHKPFCMVKPTGRMLNVTNIYNYRKHSVTPKGQTSPYFWSTLFWFSKVPERRYIPARTSNYVILKRKYRHLECIYFELISDVFLYFFPLPFCCTRPWVSPCIQNR